MTSDMDGDWPIDWRKMTSGERLANQVRARASVPSRTTCGGHSGANDLHEVAQHPAVVDDTGENTGHRGEVVGREVSDEERRHVLHPAALAAIDGGLGDELGCHALADVPTRSSCSLSVA
jgi:hypothetical protein